LVDNEVDINNEYKFRETQFFYECKSWNKKFCRNKDLLEYLIILVIDI